MQKVGDEWVSKGWNELEHKGWIFKAVSRPPFKADSPACAAISDELASVLLVCTNQARLDALIRCSLS
jgi:hypothetical protein